MSVASTRVSRKYTNVAAATAISVDIQCYDETHVVVYYGVGSYLATRNTDYVVALSEPDYNTFTLTPTASLVAKINALTAADPNETNQIIVRRVVPLLTDITADAVRYRQKVSDEFDLNTMRIQQIDDAVNRSLKSNDADGADLLLPDLSRRSNKVFGFDGDGKPTVANTTTEQLDALTLAGLETGAVPVIGTQVISDGVQTVFDTGTPLVSTAQLWLFIGASFQPPGAGAYTVVGTTFVLTEAAPEGIEINWVVRELTEVPTVEWGNVTSKPTTLAGYGITDAYTQTVIDAALAGKSNIGHTHAVADVTGLQTALDGKLPTDGTGIIDGGAAVRNAALTSRVTVGTAQGGTSTTITLDAANAAVDDMFVGLDVVITGGTGSGQTRRIGDYVGSTRVATVTAAWTTTPDSTSTYELRVPAAAAAGGKRWRMVVKDWTSAIGNGGGGRLVLEYDTSAAGDWSSTAEVQSWSINTGPAMNGNDGEAYTYQQVTHIVSNNDLRLPPTPENNDVVSGLSKTGTTSSPLDVGPQLVFERTTSDQVAGSQLVYIMSVGRDAADNAALYGGILSRVADDAAGAPAGEWVVTTAGSDLPWVWGGAVGGGLWVQSASGYAPHVGASGTCDNKGDGTVNAAGLYDQGRRVAVTGSADQPVFTTTGATTVTLPTSGTLATLAGAETLTNKTLTSPTLSDPAISGTLTVNASSGGITMFGGGDSNSYLNNVSSGNIIFRTANGVAQFAVLHAAGATRYPTVTGSNGGDPQIGTTAGRLQFGSVPALPSYTVATLPTATAQGLIYVSDEAGGAVVAFADGTNWRRVTDRAVVS